MGHCNTEIGKKKSLEKVVLVTMTDIHDMKGKLIDFVEGSFVKL